MSLEQQPAMAITTNDRAPGPVELADPVESAAGGSSNPPAIVSRRRLQRLVIVGAVTRDILLTPIPGSGTRSAKRTCTKCERIGGAAVNAARAAVAAGVAGLSVEPCFIVGSDAVGDQVVELLGYEFRTATFDRAYSRQRESFIPADQERVYTIRPPMNRDALSPAMRDSVATADLVIVAPMAPDDQSVVLDALEAARRSVLMLSVEQLGNPDAAWNLIRRADLTILNDAEARELTGQDPQGAIRVARDHGCRAMIVTHKEGAWAYDSGNWYSVPSLAGDVVRTAGAGDSVVGTYCAAVLAGRDVRDALLLSQAAAARHVAALAPVPLDGLRAALGGIPVNQDPDPDPESRPLGSTPERRLLRLGRAVALGVSLGLAATLLLAILGV